MQTQKKSYKLCQKVRECLDIFLVLWLKEKYIKKCDVQGEKYIENFECV